MRILHIGKYYSPRVGGMETILRNIAEGLLDADQEVRLVVAGNQSEACAQTIVGPRSGRTALLVRAESRGTWNSQPLTWTLPAVLHRTLAEFRPDLVHLHVPNPLAAGAWSALRLWPGRPRPPLVVWHHADITRQRIGRLLVGPLMRTCWRGAAGICVSSAALKEGSQDLLPWRSKVAVIPFGIDPLPWIKVRPRRDGPFLFVGRLVPYKGLGVLLEAVASLEGAELVVVGEGPLAASLATEVRQRGLTGRVSLLGRVDPERLPALYAGARALVLPSLDRSETFGVVQLEAMASGLPVIASDLPTGVREVGLPDRTCLLVKPGDSLALREAMRRLLTDPSLAEAMGEQARCRFQAEFTQDRMLALLVAWYRGILDSPIGGAS